MRLATALLNATRVSVRVTVSREPSRQTPMFPWIYTCSAYLRDPEWLTSPKILAYDITAWLDQQAGV